MSPSPWPNEGGCRLPHRLGPDPTRSPGRARRQPVVGVDALGIYSERYQGTALRAEVLPVGGAAGVSDADCSHALTAR